MSAWYVLACLGFYPVNPSSGEFVIGAPHMADAKLHVGDGEAVSQTEEFILITTEAKWYRNKLMTGKGVPELDLAAMGGDDFAVDYVRVFDIVNN